MKKQYWTGQITVSSDHLLHLVIINSKMQVHFKIRLGYNEEIV
jgi:hypothetical protein